MAGSNDEVSVSQEIHGPHLVAGRDFHYHQHGDDPQLADQLLYIQDRYYQTCRQLHCFVALSVALALLVLCLVAWGVSWFEGIPFGIIFVGISLAIVLAMVLWGWVEVRLSEEFERLDNKKDNFDTSEI